MIQGSYFPPYSSAKQEVTLYIDADAFVHIEQRNIRVALNKVSISHRVADTERILRFENGAAFHTLDNDALDNMLSTHIKNTSLGHRLESRWRYALLSLVLMVGFVWFSLTGGASLMSNIITPLLPQTVLNDVSKQTLQFMDEHFLDPSELNTSTKQIIQKHFDDLTYGKPYYHLHFYKSTFLKANAFALPSGDIVITDDMVRLSSDTQYRDILGVLAHECGHVAYRHSLRASIKTAVSGIVVAFFVGDFSTLATAVSTFLINNQYSQEHEKEADTYAVQALLKRDISPKYLSHLFEKLDKNTTHGEDEKGFFSTHPLTQERIRYFLSFDK